MKKDVYIKNKELEKNLNELLSDYQLYYQNLHAFHWLIKGLQFYQLHGRFKEFYDEAADDIDEVAERILMIGAKPLHSFEDYIKNSSIKTQKDLEKSFEIIPVVISNFESLFGSFHGIVEVAGDSDDEGTVALMGDFISATEKKLWMLNSMQV